MSYCDLVGRVLSELKQKVPAGMDGRGSPPCECGVGGIFLPLDGSLHQSVVLCVSLMLPADEKHLSKCKICVLLTLVLTSQWHWNKFTLSKQELTIPTYKPGATRLACLDTG